MALRSRVASEWLQWDHRQCKPKCASVPLVDPKPPPYRYKIAPSAPSVAAEVRLPGAEAWPRVDDHRVAPETRQELVRGHTMQAVPANPPHADRHCQLDYVIRGSVAEGYVSATDLLTRASEDSDFATDTCVRRRGIDPATGTRWLEELAFEVVAEQSRRQVTLRAEALSARGVRRVVALFVKTGEVCEWSPEDGAWRPLDPEGTVVDPALARPLPVRALLDGAAADDAVARALRAKDNPVLASLEAAGVERGRRQGIERGIEAACELLGITLGPSHRAQIRESSAADLEALLDRIRRERRWP